MQKIYVVDSCRTNNFNDTHFLEKVSKLWNNLFSSYGSAEIKYGVYHNYENDYKGDYTLSIGVEGSIDNSDVLEIPKSEYKIFEVDLLKAQENAIFETWKSIWDLEEKGLLKRDYVMDFEKYYLDGRIEIHIGINKRVV